MASSFLSIAFSSIIVFQTEVISQPFPRAFFSLFYIPTPIPRLSNFLPISRNSSLCSRLLQILGFLGETSDLEDEHLRQEAQPERQCPCSLSPVSHNYADSFKDSTFTRD
ncbi:hypothetical protein ACLOJK_009669 [Asimina triloba]